LKIFVEIFDLGARRRYRRERSEFFGMPNKRRHAHTQEDLQDMPEEIEKNDVWCYMIISVVLFI